MIEYQYLLVVLLGLVLLVGGFWLGQESKAKALRIVGPPAGVVGLIVIFVGILLTCVPGFFTW
jgi:hypothetical protein